MSMTNDVVEAATSFHRGHTNITTNVSVRGSWNSVVVVNGDMPVIVSGSGGLAEFVNGTMRFR